MNLTYSAQDHRVSEPSGIKDGETLFRLFMLKRSAYMYASARQAPESLTLEPRGACSLACTFCYVKDKTNLELPMSRVVEFLDATPSIKTVQVYGGDICDRPKWAAELMQIVKDRKLGLSVSTGAYHLNEEMMAMFEDVAKHVTFSMQISLEPASWMQRISHSGEHIMNVLKRNDTLSKVASFHVNTVIPTSREVPFVSYSAYLTEIAEMKGDWNFSASFFPEANEACSGLSPLFDAWERESFALMHSDKRYRNKTLYFMAWEYNPFIHGQPYRYTNCDVTSSVALGPDGKVYSCHEQAVDLKTEWRKGGLHTAQHEENVHQWAHMMDNTECRSCNARYVCGGVCYKYSVGKTNSQCQFWARSADTMLNYIAMRHPSKFVTALHTLEVESQRVASMDTKAIDSDYELWKSAKSFTEAKAITDKYAS